MSDLQDELLGAFEDHSAEDIRKVIDAGFDVRSEIRGKTAVNCLLEMYSRSDRFPDCLRTMLDAGASLDDPKIAPVLLNDTDALRAAITADPSLLEHRTDMNSAFTSLIGASLLHVAAEYLNLAAAKVLIEMGADVNAQAALDENGLNGHTPLFHTVNSSFNRAEPVMRLLLENGAKTGISLNGIIWGKGFEWETTFFDVTPISYAQMGLVPQVHRREADIYHNIVLLLKAAARDVPPLENIPNKYLGK